MNWRRDCCFAHFGVAGPGEHWVLYWASSWSAKDFELLVVLVVVSWGLELPGWWVDGVSSMAWENDSEEKSWRAFFLTGED